MDTQDTTILHITDLHLYNPEGENELLRVGFYDEYLDQLVTSIQKNHDKVDILVITGDVVHRGNLNCFTHAETVIQHLVTQLNISKNNIIICNGNHDVNRDDDKNGNITEARTLFRKFRESINSQKWGDKNEFCFFQISEEVYALSLDSTINALNGGPGELAPKVIDEILTKVKSLNSNSLLLLASHHPASHLIVEGAPFIENDTAWVTKHQWQKAHSLLDRLRKSAKCQVIWFSGDIHLERYCLDQNIHCIVTGRLGTAVDQTSQIRRQARVIQLKNNNIEQHSLYTFEPEGHNEHAQLGTWKHNSIEHDGTSSRKKANHSLDNAPQPATELTNSSKTSTKTVETIDIEAEKELMETIARKKLYSLGRFLTSHHESTLAWVPMGPLLDQSELLNSVVNCFVKKVKSIISKTTLEKALIIGMDCWGAIFASQISVATGVRNCCIANRADGNRHSSSERSIDRLKNEINNASMIFVISDVIGTGKSMSNLYQQLSGATSTNAKWILLSVLCDEMCNRESNLSFADQNWTICKGLRIPTLPNNNLPDKKILPPDISFIL